MPLSRTCRNTSRNLDGPQKFRILCNYWKKLNCIVFYLVRFDLIFYFYRFYFFLILFNNGGSYDYVTWGDIISLEDSRKF